MKVVIFAGGVGSRLWPLSRRKTPKQFEKIIGDKSTLQLAVDRILPLLDSKDIFISSGLSYKDVLYSQLPQIPKENFILEPVMRDVGAAVGLVTSIMARIAPTEPFFILWSDHLVKNEELFRVIIKAISSILEKDKNKIVFMGQRSRFASQNLGWIEMGNKIDEDGGLPVYEFKSMHYRPQLVQAENFHGNEKYVWNPGYFGTTAEFLFGLYKKFSPSMYEALLKIGDQYSKPEFESVLKELYPSLEKASFDNLILEKIDPVDGLVIPEDFGWSDVGAWEALKEALSSAEQENVTKGNVLLEDSADSLVYNYKGQLVVGIDLSEMLVINTDDVILVCPKKSVPKIKKLVEGLEGTPHEHLV